VALGLAAVTGTALARLALGPATRFLELDPSRQPAPTLVVPLVLLAAVVVGVLALVALGAVTAQASADRVRPAEVMRQQE
jgi:hypothetical protein